MKRKALLIMLLMAMFAPLAMQAQGLVKANRADLQAITAQNLVMQKTSPTRGWLQYDDGTLVTNLGNSQAYYWTYGPMFPASMLGDNNTLTKVSFFETSYMITDVTIEVYSGGDDAPGDLLYSEDVALSGSNGFHEVELTQSVTIDPSQNLWIIITVGGTYAIPLCQSDDENNNWVDNGEWGHLSDLGFAGYGYLIRAYVEYETPSNCPKPTQLTATDLTPYTATLSWHSDEEVSAWQIVYSTDEGFDPNTASPIDVEENPYTLTNLNDGTTYYAYIRSDCGDEFSNWSSMAIFETPSTCDAPFNLEVSNVTPTGANISWEGWQDTYTVSYQTLAFYDDFENGLDNWTIYTEGEVPTGLEGWRTINPANGLSWQARSGEYVASSWSWSTSAYHADNWLITPQLPLGGAVKFYVYTNQGYPDDYEVLLSTTDNEIESFTITLQEMAQVPTTGDWVEVNIDLSAYAGQQGYIALHHVFYDGNYILVDDFMVSSAAGVTTLNNVTSPVALDGLTPGDGYFVQIQGNCASGQTEWSSIAFSTLSACTPPFNLEVLEVGSNNAIVSWEGYQENYTVQYRTSETYSALFYDDFSNGIGDWTTVDLEEGGGVMDSTLFAFHWTENPPQYLISPEFEPAPAGSVLQFLFAAYDADYPESFMIGFSYTTNDLDEFEFDDNEFTTFDDNAYYYSIEVPEGAKYFCVACTSSDAYYLLVTDFLIYYPLGTEGEWITIEDATSPLTIPGLDPETWYDWQVQGVGCAGEGSTTEWSEIADFQTTEITTLTQTVALSAGANWFSTYVDITLDDLKNALVASGIAAPITIKAKTSSTTYNGTRWRGALNTLDLTQMYKIQVSTAGEIELTGLPINPAELQITIKNGPNWIAFPFTENMSIANAFAGFAINGDVVKSKTKSATYNGTRWRGTLNTLESGQGYVYNSSATEERIFTYPTNAKKSIGSKMSLKDIKTMHNGISFNPTSTK